MSDQPLVSIIIPTYNRAHLIGETLDSVLAQTYQNWECIVVDDGSTDDTDKVMAQYCAKDFRFQYHHRPQDRLSGGNAARNYGFEVSKGEYLNWFDDDDLMMPEKLELKVKTILEYKVDFVISQTQYFNRYNYNGYEYNFKAEDITFLSYSTTYISWFTPDIFLKRSVAEKISFNESLKAGQEYNFSCKLLLETQSFKKLDKVLTLRRHHSNSIGRRRQLSRDHYNQTTFDLYWTTLNELRRNYNMPKEFEKYALLKCIRSYFENQKIQFGYSFHKSILRVFRAKACYFYLGIVSNMLFNKNHFFYNQLK